MSSIFTFTGRWVDVLQFGVQDVDLTDIAHQLALTNRWRGATRFPISVAQHAVAVSLLVSPRSARLALHHDDHEAYTGDVPSPLKASAAMSPLRDAEAQIQAAIHKHLGIEEDFTASELAIALEEVHYADQVMRQFESRYCNGITTYQPINQQQEDAILKFWRPGMPWIIARTQYLKREQELCRA